LLRSDLSLSEARRITLAAQGFDRPRPGGRVDLRHLRRAIRQLGLLQIDLVNVLLPAQYQVLFSRLGPYQLSHLDDLVYRRREFTEQWGREASIVPVDRWALFRHRMDGHDRRFRALARFMEENAVYADWVLDQVRKRGPLTAGDLPGPDGTRERAGDWWGWTTAKSTLEGHFARGTLAVADRRGPGWARVYDLAQRVLPPNDFEREIERDDAHRELLRLAARSHGIGTASDLADYYRIPIKNARQRIVELVAAGELREVRVQGWREIAYLHPAARLPHSIDARALLSPFDPVVWHRPRVQRLFDFEYLLEIWVPQAQRRWGYYVLPFLLGDRLVARVDLKADRAARSLRVQSAYIEPHANPRGVAHALAGELQTLAGWLGLESLVVRRRGNLSRPLAAELRTRGARTAAYSLNAP
jgi:uncharacterized protein YcaQ